MAGIILRELPQRQSGKPREGWARSPGPDSAQPRGLGGHIPHVFGDTFVLIENVETGGKQKGEKYKSPRCLPIDLEPLGLLLCPGIIYIFH